MTWYRITYSQTVEIMADDPRQAVTLAETLRDSVGFLEIVTEPFAVDRVEEIIPQPSLTRTVEWKEWA